MEFSGRGDPVRSMELLWGTARPSGRGPKQTLTLEQVVTAAVESADADGLDKFSMRRVADRLGVGTMSLYTYVPAKAELLDLMLDAVRGERDPGGTDPTGAARQSSGDGVSPEGWRNELESRARGDLARHRRHPWMLQVAGARSVLGPHEMDAFEASLATVSGLGLSGGEMVSVVGLIGAYVRGAAKAVVSAEVAPVATGQSDDEWWAARAPLLAEVFDPDRFPMATAVQAAGAFDGDDGDDRPSDDATPYLLAEALANFEFGLQRVLDGIAAFVDNRPGSR